MAISSTPIIHRDVTCVISDNTGTPKTWTLFASGGTLKLTGLTPSQKTTQEFMSCGDVYASRMVDSQEIGVEFDCDAVHIIGDGTTATFGDVMLKRGAWASAVSTLPTAAGDTFCVTMTFTVERSNFGATADNTVVLKYVAGASDFSQGVPSKWGFKGRAIMYSTDGVTIS